MPLSHAATVVAWPSSGSHSSDTIVMWSRNFSIGFRIGMNSKFSPTVFGVQKPGRSPSGTKTAPNRRVGLGAAAVLASAVSAGTIDSSSGSASVTPTPRRNVRLGNDILVMNMVASSFVVRPTAGRLPTIDAFYRAAVRTAGFSMSWVTFIRFWNGALLTMPSTIDENLLSWRAASRTIARTVGMS